MNGVSESHLRTERRSIMAFRWSALVIRLRIHSYALFPWDGRDLASDGRALDCNILLAKTLLFVGSQGAIATEGHELGPPISSARGPGRALDVNVRRPVVVGVD